MGQDDQSSAGAVSRDPIVAVAIEPGQIPDGPPKPKKQKLTPREVSRLWGVSVSRVKKWILAGDLRAMNASVDAESKRPLFLIDLTALKEFEDRREAAVRGFVPVKTVPARRGGRRKNPATVEVTEYY